MPHPPKPAAFLVLIALAGSAHALPPLGLTPLGPATIDYQHVMVIGDNAYLGRSSGVTVVDGGGSVTDVDLSHPMDGSPVSVTRVVATPDGAIYAGANFGVDEDFAALYRLDQPADPVVTWPRLSNVRRVLPSLDSIGNINESAATLYLDGTVDFYETPARYNYMAIGRATSTGFAFATAPIVGTIGSDLLLLGPDRTVYRALDDQPLGISERDDSGDIALFLNGSVTIGIPPSPVALFRNPLVDNSADVRPSDYSLTGTDLIIVNGVDNKHGVSTDPILTGPPGGSGPPLILRPIVEVFPNLPPLVDSRLIDVDTIDGRFYLLFENDGQAFLFGALDPTVIPEPCAFALAAMLAAGLLAGRRGGSIAPR